MIIKLKFPDSVNLKEQVEVDFLQMMVDHVATSFFKYGPFRTSDSAGLPNALERISLYRQTGQLDYLADAANFLMKEFMDPQHPKAYRRTTLNADKSPGRIIKGGGRSHTKPVGRRQRIQREGD